jgi:hypothetical protein
MLPLYLRSNQRPFIGPLLPNLVRDTTSHRCDAKPKPVGTSSSNGEPTVSFSKTALSWKPCPSCYGVRRSSITEIQKALVLQLPVERNARTRAHDMDRMFDRSLGSVDHHDQRVATLVTPTRCVLDRAKSTDVMQAMISGC